MTIKIKKNIKQEDFSFLENKFLALANRYFLIGESSGLWNEIVEYYSNENRYYHNLSHLLTFFNNLRDEDISEELSLAIWYHDIIYDSTRKDNELRSGELFKERWKDVLDEDKLEKIFLYILSTEKHQPLTEDVENLLLLDLDLLTLSASPEVYDKYAEAVRKEYVWVPEEMYSLGRKNVLTSFLEKESIYFTPEFKKEFETQARANLAREIESLN